MHGGDNGLADADRVVIRHGKRRGHRPIVNQLSGLEPRDFDLQNIVLHGALCQIGLPLATIPSFSESPYSTQPEHRLATSQTMLTEFCD